MWNAKQHAMQLTSITDTEQDFNLQPKLELGDLCACQFKAVFATGAVNPLVLNFYETLDDSSEQWDSLPFDSLTIHPDKPVASFLVRDRFKFRVGAVRAGTSETVTSVDFYYRTAVQV